MIKLTKAGKIIVGCFTGLFLVICYMIFFSGNDVAPVALDADGIPYTTLVAKPSPPYKFPLSAEQSAQWHQDAQSNLKWMDSVDQSLSYCTLMDESIQHSLRRHPIEFLAIVGDTANPYYLSNAGGAGKSIYPVYPIENKDGGEKLALQATGGSNNEGDSSAAQDQLTNCGIKVEGQDTAVPVLVQFAPNTSLAQNQIVRVQGFIAGTWARTSALIPAPLVIAGHTERAFGQEIFAPTKSDNGRPMEFDLNINLRHKHDPTSGGVTLHLGKIQYAARQTRIWVQIYNGTNKDVATSWTGITDSKLSGPGDSGVGQDLCSEGICLDDQSFQAGDLQPQVAAGLLQDKLLTAKTSIQGWLVFPRMDYGPTLTLRMPDVPPLDQASNGQLPFIVKIHPPR